MARAGHESIIEATRADADVIGYEWRLSSSHPEPDICDYYAGIELGLGRGIWPKDRVPESKAHPQCMCLLIPTTRARPEKGETGYADFAARLAPAQRAKFLPRWARRAQDLGVDLDRLLRPDGMEVVSRAEAEGLLGGADRLAAIEALGRAKAERVWPERKIALRGGMWRRTLAKLAPHFEVPEVAALLRRIQDTDGRGVDSRQLHYVLRRYVDGESLQRPEDLDRWYEAVFADGAATVHRQPGADARYHIYSEGHDRIVSTDVSGHRITALRPRRSADLENLGPVKWTLGDLIDSTPTTSG